MIYLAGAVALVAIVSLIGRTGVRTLVFLALTLFGAVYLYFLDKGSRGEATLRDIVVARESVIEPRELSVALLRLTPFGYDSYELGGIVTNNSKSQLTTMSFRIVASECSSTGGCRVVGERNASIIVAVSPGQTREFRSLPIAFANLETPLQKRSFEYSLIGASAD